MPEKLEVTLQVTTPVQAEELRAAWQEIVTGRKLAHAVALGQSLGAIMERARAAIETIETTIREHATTVSLVL